MRWLCILLLLVPAISARADLWTEALAAEQRFDSARALENLLALDRARPNDPLILQKIARQYSDLVLDQPDTAAKRLSAELALNYSERAFALDPRNAVNALSVAISHGKLATYSGTREKLSHSRQVRAFAEQALALDPHYAWAHHVLGRWHREVAELGTTARWFVRVFYGGLPGASVSEALAHLQRAVALEPDQLQHWLELGFAAAAAGRTDLAREAWLRGLGLPDREKHDAAAKQRARAALAALE